MDVLLFNQNFSVPQHSLDLAQPIAFTRFFLLHHFSSLEVPQSSFNTMTAPLPPTTLANPNPQQHSPAHVEKFTSPYKYVGPQSPPTKPHHHHNNNARGYWSLPTCQPYYKPSPVAQIPTVTSLPLNYPIHVKPRPSLPHSV